MFGLTGANCSWEFASCEHLFGRVCSGPEPGGTLERPLDIAIRVDRTGSLAQFRETLQQIRREHGDSALRKEADAVAGAERLAVKEQTQRSQALIVRRRIVELERELAAFELAAIGYERGVESLLGDMVDRVEAQFGPNWSPWPVFGYRLWLIKDDGLYGAFDRWHTPELTADCKQRSVGDEPVPHDSTECGPPSCGIYAVKDLSGLLTEFSDLNYWRLAVGLVALAGRVIEHSRAYRAQHARVVAVSAVVDRRMLLTSDRQRIFELFENPLDASLTFPDVTKQMGRLDQRAVDFLIDQERKHT